MNGNITFTNPGQNIEIASSVGVDAFRLNNGETAQHTGDITITNGDYTVAQLKSLSSFTKGKITLTVGDNNLLIDTVENIKGALSDLSKNFIGNIKLSDATNAKVKITDVNAIIAKHAGRILQFQNTVDLVGTIAEIDSIRLSGKFNNINTFRFTITDQPTLDQIIALNNAVTGNITLKITMVNKWSVSISSRLCLESLHNLATNGRVDQQKKYGGSWR